MAQTFTSTACQTFGTTGFFINPPKYIEDGMVVRASTIYLSSFSATASAILQMVPVPKGCQIHDVVLSWDMAGGGGGYTLAVGDGNGDQRYINGGTSMTGSGVLRLGQALSAGSLIINQGGTLAVGYSYSVDDTIDIKVITQGAYGASATLRLQVLYSMDNNQKG